jgi:hypothetical protein
MGRIILWLTKLFAEAVLVHLVESSIKRWWEKRKDRKSINLEK